MKTLPLETCLPALVPPGTIIYDRAYPGAEPVPLLLLARTKTSYVKVQHCWRDGTPTGRPFWLPVEDCEVRL